MNLEIANRLVALRKERGLSQEDLANQIGVSRQAISKWERAEASPDIDNLVLLARLYQVSLDELLSVHPEGTPTSGDGEWSGTPPAPNPAQAQWAPVPVEEAAEESIAPIPVEEGQSTTPEVEHINATLITTQSPPSQESDDDTSSPFDQWGGRAYSTRPAPSLAKFPYPILCVFIYLALGFLMNFWHPGWMIFLTIPIYYALVSGTAARWALYPVLCTFAFLVSGFFFGLWHPGWMIFLTIPIYYWYVGTQHKQ